jgi:hypothetical protein
VALDEPHVSVGGMLEVGQIGKKGYFWKEGMHEESDNWKEEKHARTCIEDLMTLWLGFL